MASIEKALQIAAKVHEEQTDKNGQPYILHPLRVMHRVEGLEAQIVGVLHDVVEDTSITLGDLHAAGFNENILVAVACVTRGKDETYEDYAVRCKSNEIARRVKLADLEDNTRLGRLLLRADRFDSDLRRIGKYILTYKFLTDRLTEEEYRRLMKINLNI